MPLQNDSSDDSSPPSPFAMRPFTIPAAPHSATLNPCGPFAVDALSCVCCGSRASLHCPCKENHRPAALTVIPSPSTIIQAAPIGATLNPCGQCAEDALRCVCCGSGASLHCPCKENHHPAAVTVIPSHNRVSRGIRGIAKRQLTWRRCVTLISRHSRDILELCAQFDP